MYMIVGGLHLGNLPRKIIRQVIEKLKPFSVEKIGMSHCTGLMASAGFVECFGKGVFFANAGTVINI